MAVEFIRKHADYIEFKWNKYFSLLADVEDGVWAIGTLSARVTSADLRIVADKLDELNGKERENG